MYCNIQQDNDMWVHCLLSIGYNGNLLSAKLKVKTKSVRASLKVSHLQTHIQVIATSSTHRESFHIMGGGHTTHYDILKAVELNNINKEEYKLENKKQDRKEIELYETHALKVL